jgi:hypothetical protein
MNNQWRDNANCMVVWADGTYDHKRSCDECHAPVCQNPVHTDKYKEIGESRYLTEQEDGTSTTYWSWLANNKPLGSRQDFDGEWVHTEFFTANPDGLPEIDAHNSGVKERIHQFAQEAFEHLTGKQKQVWQLCMREQCNEPEAARRLGVTRSTVATHLSRAKASFTEYLRNKGSDSNVGA